jgi:hypothetical protein
MSHEEKGIALLIIIYCLLATATTVCKRRNIQHPTWSLSPMAISPFCTSIFVWGGFGSRKRYSTQVALVKTRTQGSQAPFKEVVRTIFGV